MNRSGLTVRSALDLEVFHRTRTTVLAGVRNLDREVRWVHTGEIPDIGEYLSGGEMLLTAGLGMGRTADRQQSFVRQVAAAGAAVLVVELSGRAFSSMPPAVVEESERQGLPLVGLQHEIPFVDVSAQIHELLVNLRTKELTSEEAIGHAFIDLLLADTDYVALSDELARRTRRPVVLEDITHQIMSYAGPTEEADDIVVNWDQHSRVLHELDLMSPGEVSWSIAAERFCDADSVNCSRRPVVVRGECWGWLHLLHDGAMPSAADIFALHRAAAAIAISLLSDREAGARAALRQGALISRLMLGDLAGEEFVARALGLGRDLHGRMLIVCVSAKDNGFGASEMAALLAGAEFPAVVADIGDDVLAVVGLRSDVDSEVHTAISEHDIRAGLSRVVFAGQLQIAVQQAQVSAAAAKTVRVGSNVLRFDELGVLRLLVTLAQGPELAQYVEDELGSLLAHDAGTTTPLLPTLRAYIQCDGNKSRAAELLFVQRRTLYYRLARIERLLHASLGDMERRLRLLLAVRGLDLLRRRQPPE